MHPSASSSTRGTPASAPTASEFLTFRLGGEEYGIDILEVQEIRGYETPTRIANAPEFVRGVVNLRGAIVPIIDLRLRFGLGEPVYNELTVVIVANVRGHVTGLVVDAVCDVTQFPAASIREAPTIEGAADGARILGLGIAGERMVILVETESLTASVGTLAAH